MDPARWSVMRRLLPLLLPLVLAPAILAQDTDDLERTERTRLLRELASAQARHQGPEVSRILCEIQNLQVSCARRTRPARPAIPGSRPAPPEPRVQPERPIREAPAPRGDILTPRIRVEPR
jgi:hypothetical protein